MCLLGTCVTFDVCANRIYTVTRFFRIFRPNSFFAAAHTYLFHISMFGWLDTRRTKRRKKRLPWSRTTILLLLYNYSISNLDFVRFVSFFLLIFFHSWLKCHIQSLMYVQHSSKQHKMLYSNLFTLRKFAFSCSHSQALLASHFENANVIRTIFGNHRSLNAL